MRPCIRSRAVHRIDSACCSQVESNILEVGFGHRGARGGRQVPGNAIGGISNSRKLPVTNVSRWPGGAIVQLPCNASFNPICFLIG